MKPSLRTACSLVVGAILSLIVPSSARAKDDPLAWPKITTQAKPHAYWWWMGSAVDTNNIAKELARYQAAGMGGVHIIPIYGAKGWESNYIPYLSPRWMEMLNFTVKEAKRRGMEVDMTTGTGWCFGGPKVTDDEANAVLVSDEWRVTSGGKLPRKVDRAKTQALMAFGPDGKKMDLLGKISADGSVDWTAPEGKWTVYAISQKPGAQKVKRAAPGGEGWMLNMAYPQAMTNYLRWMDGAFANYKGVKPRAQYHDSYEYKMDWSPALFAEFEKRGGYRLQDHLDAFITGQPADRAARVKCDYRETISDIMVEETAQWTKWSHERGFITRNEAHGSPGNWLDLYAAADIPETEMFHLDRNILISKFASSAAHVSGKPLVGAETGTWLTEHFTETLADMKYLLDDLFLSGVNHVFYHGTCYSPDEAPWPGWVFYASYEMNPRNAVWHDVAALNAYAARCQSVLQAGQPDNDILLYWPIHDFWSDAEGTTRNLTVHARDWFEEQPIGKTAEALWKWGYQFDYVSDRQLAAAKPTKGGASLGNSTYKAIVVPACNAMPLETFAKLEELATKCPVAVVFMDKVPSGVPGLARLESHAKEFSIRKNKGWFGVGSLNGVPESLRPIQSLDQVDGYPAPDFEGTKLMYIRRKLPDGRYYFVVNRGDTPVRMSYNFGIKPKSIIQLDPMTGSTRLARTSIPGSYPGVIDINLEAGQSTIFRTFDYELAINRETRKKSESDNKPTFERDYFYNCKVEGLWRVEFISGGPVTPPSVTTTNLASWTAFGDTNAASFAGTAVYSLKFDATAGLKHQLDLGKVCQSARVRLNGKDYGTLITPPFRVVVDNLKAKDNLLEVEVTNTSANRIRDLDRRGVKWQNFHDINFVNLNYKKFDASDWPLADSGLLGPVTLTPVSAVNP